MHRLSRTRSQHFVRSPRKTASPFKHSRLLTRQPNKRRRLGTSALAVNRPIFETDTDGTDESASPEESRRRRSVHPLSSEIGQRRVNRSRSGRRDAQINGQRESDVFSLAAADDDYSPKKRKRSNRASSSDDDSNSWVEMDETEEVDFIVESRFYLPVIFLFLAHRHKVINISCRMLRLMRCTDCEKPN